jgi:hypothetical protein
MLQAEAEAKAEAKAKAVTPTRGNMFYFLFYFLSSAQSSLVGHVCIFCVSCVFSAQPTHCHTAYATDAATRRACSSLIFALCKGYNKYYISATARHFHYRKQITQATFFSQDFASDCDCPGRGDRPGLN